MKPRNFPSRKLQRQILASQRQSGEKSRPFSDSELLALSESSGVKTKKDRRSK
jgi:hypothetical protein